MDDRDYQAACELALDLEYLTAAKFLRSQIGLGLIEAIQLAYNLAIKNPSSFLAGDVQKNNWQKP